MYACVYANDSSNNELKNKSPSVYPKQEKGVSSLNLNKEALIFGGRFRDRRNASVGFHLTLFHSLSQVTDLCEKQWLLEITNTVGSCLRIMAHLDLLDGRIMFS